ncbi:MAG: nucleotide exchange factor GrpE [Nitrospirae bacterium]|nr:nucleotide exchange factor GrpE [Nitrospirota bacterium]
MRKVKSGRLESEEENVHTPVETTGEKPVDMQSKAEEKSDNSDATKKELSEINDKYLRLYADFENYRRRAAKDREETIKYSNEELMKDLLSVIDHLELALQHSSNNETSAAALSEGVRMTLKELKSTLEKFGLVDIPALGNPFNPAVHHAMAQVESEESEENSVVKEFRKGYMYKDKVLRASLVGVSKKSSQKVKIEKQEKQEE